MDNVSCIFFAITIIAVFVVLLFLVTDICLLIKTRKKRGEPYYMLNLLKYIIYIEIELILIDACVIALLCIIRGMIMDLWMEIIINILCSLIISFAVTLFVYFKFLKHIPEETKKQIDTLLNDRLGYETTNHNAVLQKGDSIQKALSDEHSEIRQNIISANKEISSLSGKIDSERKLKELQYEYLNDNNKSIIQNINKISALGEVLQKVNLENTELKQKYNNIKIENQKLTQENSELKEELAQYQTLNSTFTQSM